MKATLLLLGAVAFLAAVWRVVTYEPARRTHPPAVPVQPTPAPAVHRTVETPAPHVPTRQEELLGETAPQAPAKKGRPTLENTHFIPTYALQDPANRPAAYPAQRASAKQTYPAQRSSYADEGQPSAQPSTVSTYNRGGSSYTAPGVNFQPSAQSAMQDERAARMLAPYLRPNRKEKEEMDARWNRLSAALERAVAQALMPKSKKDSMIEKYSAAAGTPAATPTENSGAFSGALAPVGNALAAQKQEIVRSFGSAFGSKAAAQAGSMMDSFAGELSAALSKPGLTADQADQQVKEIAAKYQEQMNQLAEKNQYDQFVQARVEQDNQQKAALQARYPDENLNAQFSQIIDAAREKDLALAGQNLPREEYFTQLAQNNQDMRNQLKDAVVRAGQSVNPLHQLEQEEAQKQADRLRAQVEAGEIESVSRPATARETMNMQKNVEVQRQDILKNLTANFGPQAAAEFEPVMNDYQNQLSQLYRQKMSVDQRRDAEVELLKNVNRQLLEKQMQQVEKMPLPDEQKEKALAQLQEAYNNIQ